MIVIDDYSKYHYTRIEAEISLDECPPDCDNEKHFVDVDLDSYLQNKCFIGNQCIESLNISRVQGRKEHPAQWTVTIVVSKCLWEPETHELLREYCDNISLACSKQLSFQNYGFRGFSFRMFDVRRQYSEDGVLYTDYDLPSIGEVEMSTTTTVQANVFAMPQAVITPKTMMQQLEDACMVALRSTDVVARYVLSYYLFEIIYGTNEWSQYVVRAKVNKTAHHWRAEALCEYLRQELGIHEYAWHGKRNRISADTLEQIINVRNDLTHRADQSQVAEMLYRHLIPILQEMLK